MGFFFEVYQTHAAIEAMGVESHFWAKVVVVLTAVIVGVVASAFFGLAAANERWKARIIHATARKI